MVGVHMNGCECIDRNIVFLDMELYQQRSSVDCIDIRKFSFSQRLYPDYVGAGSANMRKNEISLYHRKVCYT